MGFTKYSALFLLFLLNCHTKEKESPVPSNEVEQIIKNFKLTETVEGITNFHLEANKALLYQNRTVAYEVILNFYKNGAHYATLTSDSGVLLTSTNDMEAMGNVKVIGVEGVKLETESLEWINADKKIKTENKVVIITKDNKKVEGRDFESDPGLTHIKLKETYGYSE